jgi:site-specific DNA-methyltransferase (adenine-specific)
MTPPLLPPVAASGPPTVNVVHHVDLLTLCAALPPQSVDMILCDLPYGTTACAWDKPIPFEPMWAAFRRVIKPRGAIVLTASQPFTSRLVCSNEGMFKYSWVWNKGFSGNFCLAEVRPMAIHEDVCIFGDKLTNYYPQMSKRDKTIKGGGISTLTAFNHTSFIPLHKVYEDKYPTSILEFPRALGISQHPTQKPVALFAYLIRTYTRSGDVVFDPCVGSGTTAIAARNEGRRYICGDSSAEYVAVARKRLAVPYTLPLPLPSPSPVAATQLPLVEVD